MFSKNEFQGTGKVYRFTFWQMLKNKGNLASLIIMVLLATFALPVMTFINQDKSSLPGNHTSIDTVWIANTCGLKVNIRDLGKKQDYFSGITIQTAEQEEEVKEALKETELLLVFQKEAKFMGMNSYRVSAYTGEETKIEEAEVNALLEEASTLLEKARYEALGIKPEQLEDLMKGYTTSVQDVTEYMENGPEFETKFLIQYIYSILVMMISVISVSYITRAVVEEKSSKLVELLMVSVKPLALVAGKILAAMSYVVLMFGLMALGFFVSSQITSAITQTSAMDMVLEMAGVHMELMNFTPLAVIGVIISIITGYATFAILAGLCGAGCTSAEETEGAVMVPTMIIMFGYIISCAASGIESQAAIIVFSMLPIVSVFCAPVGYLCGSIGFEILAIAWVVQIFVALILAVLGGRVYRDLIIYRGEKINIGKILLMAIKTKGRKAGKEQ